MNNLTEIIKVFLTGFVLSTELGSHILIGLSIVCQIIVGLITSASVIRISTRFDAQKIVKDFLSCFFIIFDNMFNDGDLIQSEGYTGTAESIRLRVTKSNKGKISYRCCS